MRMFKTFRLLKTYKTEFLLGILFVFPLLPINFIGFIGVLISVILIYSNKNKSFSSLEKKQTLISIAFYLLLILSVVYSDNYANGFKEVLKTILLILFPISIILFSTIEKAKTNTLLMLYLIINILLCLYIFGLAIEILAYKKMTFLNEANIFEKIIVFLKTPYYIPFNWSSTDFRMFLFFHKAYISMSWCLSAFISLYFILYQKNKLYINLLLLLAYFIFCYFIFYMSSVPNLISLFIGTVLIVLFKLKIKTNIIILSIGLLALIITFNSYNSKIENRIQQDFRIHLWKAGWNAVNKDLVLGLGFGDHDDSVKSSYKSYNMDGYKKAINLKMNSHNQYLSLIISGGFVCVFLFLFMLFINFKNGFVSKDVLLLTFTILIVLNFSFESMLDRIYGIYFFSFFNSFFIKRNLIK